MTTDTKPNTTLYSKIVKVMAAVHHMKKDKKNNHYKYDYISADQVFSTIRASMIEHNMACLAETVNVRVMDEHRYLVEYRFTLVCADTGETQSHSWWGETKHTTSNGSVDDRSLNKCATNSLKYFLLKTFLIHSNEDSEIDENEDTAIWATNKNIETLYQMAQAKFPSLSKPEFLKAAGITAWTKYGEWAEKYETGKAAGIAIMEALKAPPPTNGNGHQSAFGKKDDVDVSDEIKDIAQQKTMLDDEPEPTNSNPYGREIQKDINF